MTNPITKAITLNNLTKVQEQYYYDEHRFIVNWAARRSRKTIIGMKKDLRRAMQKPNQNIYLAAPTQDQATEIFLKHRYFNLSNITVKMGLTTSNKIRESVKPKIELNNGSTLRIVGLDKAQRIEGIPCHGIHITEFPDVKSGMWQEHILPILAENKAWAILDGTPDYRYPHYQDIANMASGNKRLDPIPYHGFVGTNPNEPDWVGYCWLASDVLPKEEIEMFRRQMDANLFAQEMEGKFIESGGRVYFAYSKDNFSDVEFASHRDTYLCYDFNVDPMTCIINQQIGIRKDTGDAVYCFVKEFVVSNSYTEHTTRKVLDWLKQKEFNGKLYVTGDPHVGKQTSGSVISQGNRASKADYAIIDNIISQYEFKYKGIPDLRAGLVKDRVASINAYFKNTLGEIKQFVNIAKCPILHNDLIRQVWDKDGKLNDENNTIGHRSDAASYFHITYYPVYRRPMEFS